MSYKFLRISYYYVEFIHDYYLRFPEIVNSSYEVQYNHLVSESIETVSSYTKSLRALGVDAIGLVSNAEPLQRKWAEENNVSFDMSQEDFMIEQMKVIKPDILWIDDSRLYTKEWIRIIRKAVPSVKIIAGHLCTPFNSIIASSLSSFDLMFSCHPCTCEELASHGVEAHTLYHSFDVSVLPLLTENNSYPYSDIVFTGSLFTGYSFHNQRIRYIEKLIATGINITIYGNIETRKKVFLKQCMYYTLNTLKILRLDFLIKKIPLLNKHKAVGIEKIVYYSDRLIKSVHPPVFGLEMFKMLSRAKICFNTHGDFGIKKCAGNVRMFEATGVGSCLISDRRFNLSDIFVADKEVVVYSTEAEFIEKINWLQKNPDEVAKIAKAGQERTLKDHTVSQRAVVLNELFIKKLALKNNA